MATIYLACFVSHEIFELWNAKLENYGFKRNIDNFSQLYFRR